MPDVRSNKQMAIIRLLDRFYGIFLLVCLVFLTIGVPFVFQRKTTSAVLALGVAFLVITAWRLSRLGSPKKSLVLFSSTIWFVLVGLIFSGLPPATAATALAFTATIQIREWESTHGRGRLPIVALTADAFEEDRQRCLSVGMDDFLVKPIDISALKKTLGHWLTTETSVQSETSATPAIELMDRRRYETLLSEAIVLVGQSKFSSLAKVKELQTAVAGTNLETELSEVNATLQNFHFDAALERLRQLKATQLQ